MALLYPELDRAVFGVYILELELSGLGAGREGVNAVWVR